MSSQATVATGASSSNQRPERYAAVAMLALGALILAMWAAFIAGGVLEQGVRTVENNQYLVFHLAAETIMGTLLILGGAGLLRHASWARPVAFLGLGMTIYSTVNSLAHSVRNEQLLTPVLLASLAVALAVTAILSRRTPAICQKGDERGNLAIARRSRTGDTVEPA